jgi:predicted esterase
MHLDARAWFPAIDPPTDGWPVLFFLHGCGGTGDEHAPHAGLAAHLGLAAFTVPGPVALRGSGRAWPADGFGATYDCLWDALARWDAQVANKLDRSQVLLCGFSQGATHVIGLLAQMPTSFAGGIALSPGEGPPVSEPDPRGPALYVAYGVREYPAFRKKARRCAEAWRQARWPCLLETHAGGHQMPPDWDNRLPRILQWLLSRGTDGGGRPDGSSIRTQ